MSWSTPGTAVNGATIPASFWNNTYKNDMALTLGALASAAGDIIYGTGANATAKLSVGNKYDALRMNAGATAPEWSTNPPSALVYNSGGVTLLVPTSTFTDVIFDTIDFNVDTMATLTAGHTSRLTFTTAGLYIVTFNYRLTTAATTAMRVKVSLYNSSDVLQDDWGQSEQSVINLRAYVNGQCLIPANAGDYIKLRVWQNSGGNLTSSSATLRWHSSLAAVMVTG